MKNTCTEEAEANVLSVKKFLATAPMPHAPDTDKEYILADGASEVAAGPCWLKVRTEGEKHITVFLSDKLTLTSAHWATR